MNKKEFFLELRKYKGKFYLNGYGIRYGRNNLCPITLVYSKKKKKMAENGEAWNHGLKLGLSQDFISEVVNAADFYYTQFPNTRKALLKAVGLS